MRHLCKTKIGHGRGQKLGFGTINCILPETLQAPHGIYTGYAYIKDQQYLAAIHFGPVPVFKDTTPTLEVHLIDQKLEINPPLIQIELLSFLRPIQNFPNEEALAEQIKKDILAIKKLLQEISPDPAGERLRY